MLEYDVAENLYASINSLQTKVGINQQFLLDKLTGPTTWGAYKKRCHWCGWTARHEFRKNLGITTFRHPPKRVKVSEIFFNECLLLSLACLGDLKTHSELRKIWGENVYLQWGYFWSSSLVSEAQKSGLEMKCVCVNNIENIATWAILSAKNCRHKAGVVNAPYPPMGTSTPRLLWIRFVMTMPLLPSRCRG